MKTLYDLLSTIGLQVACHAHYSTNSIQTMHGHWNPTKYTLHLRLAAI